MPSRLVPGVILLAIALLFFWKFVFLGRIPIDPTPLYETRPWSRMAEAKNVAHVVDPARYYHNIDPILEVLPLKTWMGRRLRSGDLPLWIPDLFCGAPFAANHHSGLWDFSTLLFLLFPAEVGFGLTLVFQLLVAGLCAFACFRIFRFSMHSSLLGATAFMFNSFFLHWLGLISFNAALIWMPLLPAGVELTIQRGSIRFCAISGVALGLSLLSGMAQFWLFNVVLLCLYGAYRSTRERRALAASALALVLGFSIGAIQLIPTVGALSYTSRGGDTRARMYAGRNHLSPRKLPTLLLPDLYGHLEENVFSKILLKQSDPLARGIGGRLVWGEKGSVLNRSWGYVGLIPFLLMLYGVAKVRPPMRFFVWLAAAVLGFQVFLSLDFFHEFMIRLWPGFDTLDHTRSIVLYSLAASALACAGLEQLLETGRTRRLLGVAIGLSAFFVLCIVGLRLLSSSGAIQTAILSLRPAADPSVYSSAFFEDASRRILEGIGKTADLFYAPLIVLVGLAGILWLLQKGRLKPPAAATLLLVLSLGDLFFHGWNDPILVFADRATIYPPGSSIVRFLQRTPGIFRVYALQGKKPMPQLPLTKYKDIEALKKGSVRFFDFRSVDFVCRPNSLLSYNVQTAGGYMSLYPGRYKDLWNGRGMDILKVVQPGGEPPVPGSSWLAMQNVKYLLVPEEVDAAEWPSRLVAEGVKVLEVPDTLPRVTVVARARIIPDRRKLLEETRSIGFDPRREVLLEEQPGVSLQNNPRTEARIETQFAPNRLRIRVQMDKSGFLVVVQNIFPGWTAQVDGKPRRILSANYAFACIPLDGGKHDVLLKYRPPFWVFGIAVTVAGSIVALTLLLGLAGARRTTRGQDSPFP